MMIEMENKQEHYENHHGKKSLKQGQIKKNADSNHPTEHVHRTVIMCVCGQCNAMFMECHHLKMTKNSRFVNLSFS